MQKGNLKLIAVAAVVVIVVLLASWQLYGDQSRQVSERFAEGMMEGDYSECYDMMSDEAKEIYDTLGGEEAFAAEMSLIVAGLEMQYGPYTGIGESRMLAENAPGTAILFQYSGAMLCTFMDAEGAVTLYCFYSYDLPSDDPVPEGIVEEDVQVGPDGMTPLPGKLSYAEGSDHSSVVVLVAGSGPHGMNCAMGENQIFQQIAWGLNEKGVDVLRYDKRTYADPIASSELGSYLDIGYETVDDAVAAAQLLDSMGYESIYVVGHSLGAMMAPAIVAQSDGLYDGMVSLAGSPRDLVQVQYDQNMAVIGAMPDGPEKDAALLLVQGEMAKYNAIGQMSQEDLLGTTIFGISAYYQKSIMDMDTVGSALALDVPMLFLQGTSDWQVSVENDYSAWLDILSGKENVEGELYVGLNHIFAIPGEGQGTTMEYYAPQTVNPSVIDDIATFVLA